MCKDIPWIYVHISSCVLKLSAPYLAVILCQNTGTSIQLRYCPKIFHQVENKGLTINHIPVSKAFINEKLDAFGFLMSRVSMKWRICNVDYFELSKSLWDNLRLVNGFFISASYRILVPSTSVCSYHFSVRCHCTEWLIQICVSYCQSIQMI